MTDVLIGVSAALGALALLLLALLVAGRRRLKELERELAERRPPELRELGTSLELDEVLSRTLAAAVSRGADAALAVLPDPGGGKAMIASRGLSAEEAERLAVLPPPDLHTARSVTMAYSYDDAADEAAIRSGLAVPLPGDPGYLAIFTRDAATELGDDAARKLEALAAQAGPAIANARRFREARQLADLDALTSLHNRRFFHETLAREIARAHRYDRSLALLVFDLDDFKAVNDQVGHLAGDTVLAEAAERVRGVVRSADVACRVGGDEFAVILPESSLADADQLYRRIRQAVTARALTQVGTLSLSAGVAELTPDDDAVTFFQRADDAMYRAKAAGKGRVVAANA